MGTITSASAVFTLSIASLYPSPQQIQGYSSDDMFDAEGQDVAEIMMGVDGVLSAGFIFKEVKQNITLQADSASNQIFEDWYTQEKAQREKLVASGTIALQSIGREYTLNNGFLMTYAPITDAKKVLQPRKFAIVWESVDPAQI